MLNISCGNVVIKIMYFFLFSTFMDAIRKTPLRNDLRANLFKTIFVPTNQAFKNLGQSYVDQLMENVTYLTEVLFFIHPECHQKF